MLQLKTCNPGHTELGALTVPYLLSPLFTGIANIAKLHGRIAFRPLFYSSVEDVGGKFILSSYQYLRLHNASPPKLAAAGQRVQFINGGFSRSRLVGSGKGSETCATQRKRGKLGHMLDLSAIYT